MKLESTRQFIFNNLNHKIVRSLMYHSRMTHKNSDNSKNPKNQIFSEQRDFRV